MTLTSLFSEGIGFFHAHAVTISDVYVENETGYRARNEESGSASVFKPVPEPANINFALTSYSRITALTAERKILGENVKRI